MAKMPPNTRYYNANRSLYDNTAIASHPEPPATPRPIKTVPPNIIPQEECEHRLRCLTEDVECICKTHWRLKCPNCGSTETFKSERSVPEKKVGPFEPTGSVTTCHKGPTGGIGPTGPPGPTWNYRSEGKVMFSIGDDCLYCANCGTMYLERLPKGEEVHDDLTRGRCTER